MAGKLKRLRPKERFLGLLLALWAALLLPHALSQFDATWAQLLSAVAFVSLLARTLAFDERLSRVGHVSLWGLAISQALRLLVDVDAASPYVRVLLVLELLVIAGTTHEVLRYVAGPGLIDRDRLYASACGYLLIGLLFSAAFELAAVVEPEGLSRVMPDRVAFRYFSFVTLSTLGYGDIVPALPLTRMLAVSEAIIGQLYLAVVVAMLVGRMGQPATKG